MRFAFKISWSSLLPRFIRFSSVSDSSTAPQQCVELRGKQPIPVTTYRDLLGVVYEDMENTKAIEVKSIHLVKKLNHPPEHQALGLTVIDHNDNVHPLSYVFLERLQSPNYRRQAETPASQSDPAFSSVPGQSLPSEIANIRSSPISLSRSSSQSSLTEEDAYGTVTPSQDKLRKGEKSLVFIDIPEDKKLYLYHLVVLATTVHDHKDAYKLFSTNCYWYAGILLDLVEKWKGVQATVIKKVRHGIFMRVLPVYEPVKPEESKLQSILDTFYNDLAKFEGSIVAKAQRRLGYPGRPRQGREEADRRAEEERQGREEADRRAEEERQRREEADRRAEEAHRRAEEERQRREDALETVRQLKEAMQKLGVALPDQANSTA